jgi:hypothetical protein
LEPYQKVGARYYDATFGRFITRDTDLSQAAYAYCNGDPVNFSDPSGHEGLSHDAIDAKATAFELGGLATIIAGVALMFVPGAQVAGIYIIWTGSAVLGAGIGMDYANHVNMNREERERELPGHDSARSGSAGLPGGALPDTAYDYYSQGANGVWHKTGSGPYQPGVPVSSAPPNPHN